MAAVAFLLCKLPCPEPQHATSMSVCLCCSLVPQTKPPPAPSMDDRLPPGSSTDITDSMLSTDSTAPRNRPIVTKRNCTEAMLKVRRSWTRLLDCRVRVRGFV